MRRCSLLFLGVAGCLVQDAAWEPPADTDARGTSGSSSSSSTSFASEGTAGGSGESTGEDSASGGVPDDGLPTDCAPLPSLPSDVQVVGPADNGTLHTIFADAAPGTTIALEPGTYDRSEQPTLIISAEGVVIRSTTGDPSDVVLDGGSTGMSTLLSLRADAILLAEFTMQGASDTLIQIGLEGTVLRDNRVYRMTLLDAAGSKLDVGPGTEQWTDGGSVACSTFSQTDAFRDTLADCSSIRALQISGGAGWTVRDNLFEGHWCTTSSYATLVADRASRDTRVERNILKNNFRGILFGGDEITTGRPTPPDDPCTASVGATWGHIRGVVVNNVIWVDDPRIADAEAGDNTALDSMIGFWHVCGALAVHNTSYVTLTTFNGIEWRYPDTSVTIANNLISTVLDERDGGVALGIATNATGILANEFQDAPTGDFRLAAGSIAVDAGIVIPAFPVLDDFDRNKRNDEPDLGAFESQP